MYVFDQNIVARSWFCLYENQLSVGSLFPGTNVLDVLGKNSAAAFGLHQSKFTFWQDDSMNMVNIDGYSTADAGKHHIFLEEWLRRLLKKERPAIFMSRRRSNLTDLHAFVATSCPDYVFCCNVFPNQSVLYKNTKLMVIVSQFSEQPSMTQIRTQWASWVRDKYVIGASLRFFLERVEDYCYLHTMGISSKTMMEIKSCGFEWNRKTQQWQSRIDDVNMGKIQTLIREDNTPSLESLGCVPEWYCEMLRNERVHNSNKREDSTALWRIFLGY